MRLARLLCPPCLLACLACSSISAPPGSGPTEVSAPRLEVSLFGQATIRAQQFQQTRVGGLSAINWDPERDLYYVVSDDRSQHSPARFYTLTVDLSAEPFNDAAIQLVDVAILTDSRGNHFADGTIDPEGLALDGAGHVYISSEGDVALGVPPFIRTFTLEGHQIETLQLPAHYLPNPSNSRSPRGIRNNLGFEPLTLEPERRYLWTGSENALAQDGPETDVEVPGPARILRFDLESRKADAEFLYWTEPVHASPVPEDAFRTNGLVELLALGDDKLLALERSFAVGAGNDIKLFLVDVSGAENLFGRESLATTNLAQIRAASKQLLANFSDLEVALENFEGMTLGPSLPDGRRSLIVISDDNFNPLIQTTRVVVLAF